MNDFKYWIEADKKRIKRGKKPVWAKFYKTTELILAGVLEKCTDCKEMIHYRNMSEHGNCYKCFESEVDRRTENSQDVPLY
tara:strand:- start:134 stop:376 length:243 start_codon:yes stop_codon:yes gene_type:complete